MRWTAGNAWATSAPRRGALVAASGRTPYSADVAAAVRVLHIPILVVHGEADAVVPCSEAIDLASAARRARLEMVLGADHGFSRPDHLRPAMRQIATFFGQTSGPRLAEIGPMLQFAPYYPPGLVWGGRRLATSFARSVPEGPVGEAWELVELDDARHSAVATGPSRGAKLGDLWRAGALGGSAQGPFPFLLKWIDAAQQLSVQVHPDEAACANMGRGRPKTEAWLVVQAEAKAALRIGHHPGLDALALRQAASGGTLQKWLYETQPRAGDVFLIEAGTIHAIGAGFLILEVQQPSDTTYRIFDYGRVGTDGQPRALHLEEAALSVNYGRFGAPRAFRQGVDGPCFSLRALRANVALPAPWLRVLVADSGPAVVASEHGTHELAYGEVVVAQPSDGAVHLVRGSAVLLTEPNTLPVGS